MADRELVALGIIVVTVLVFGGLAMRKMEKRRRFRIRQAGRGKGNASAAIEPAE
jgi:hypothetical protein